MILKKRGIIRSIIFLLISIPCWWYVVKGHNSLLRVMLGLVAGFTNLYLIYWLLILPFIITKGASERTRKRALEKADKWYEKINWHDHN